VDFPLVEPIVAGFATMNGAYRPREGEEPLKPSAASCPFSLSRRGFVVSEGAGVIVLAAEEMIARYGLQARAEVMGVGWTSDAYHFTKPNPETIVRGIREALDDAALRPSDIQYINAHGTSTLKGDLVEVECLRTVFGRSLEKIPLSSNKSQIGHTLGAAAAIEDALTIEGMQRGMILPTINHLPDPRFADIDCVPNTARPHRYEMALSNAFGFGGTNCCIICRGVA
jgi:3-oxoacyl-[acyl-carrier-protein] synthase II